MTLVAMDVHKNTSTIAALHPSTGEIIIRRCYTDRNDIARKLADLPRPWTVAVESSRQSPPVCRWLVAMGAEVKLAHPQELAQLIKLRSAKTDEIDAETMLHLMRADCLPECYLAPEEVVELRDLTRGRYALVRISTMLRNLLRSIFTRAGLEVEQSDLRGKAAQQLVPELIEQLPLLAAMVATIFWKLLAAVEVYIERLNKEVTQQAQGHPVARELAERPGLGDLLALSIVAEMGEVERFESYKNLHSYAGLVPRSSESGDTRRDGSLPKWCNRHLRRVAVQAAQCAIRCRDDNKPKAKYDQLKERRKAVNTAKIAAARKVLTDVFFTWQQIVADQAA